MLPVKITAMRFLLRSTIIFALVLLAWGALAAQGQHADQSPAVPERNPRIPTVTFTYEFEGAIPSRYAITIESSGTTAYHSDGPQQEIADYRTPSGAPYGEPFNTRFVISNPIRNRVFALAEKLNYFQGDFDFKKSRIANTGAKTLIYAGPKQHNETTYNWSQTLEIQELTKLFQDISATMEFGRRLQYMYRHSKLSLEGELKSMEAAAQQDSLAEMQAVTPILTIIAKDTSVMHIARARAQRMLDRIPVQDTSQ